MEKAFIKTFDDDTAEKLIKLGFQQVDTSDGSHTFLNCQKLCFSDNDVDIHKIAYSNVLCI